MGEKDIRISDITSIQIKSPGLMGLGYIQFTFPGARESKGGTFNAQSDENSVTFGRKHAREFETIRTEIDRRRSDPSPPSSTAASSPLDQLEKLASLRDRGIVTEDEFQQKKRQILDL